jgi:hypothetical protein
LVGGFKVQINVFKLMTFNQGKDLNFKMIFGPMDLNSIYFIEFKGRFRMDIGSNFEWTWVNWTMNNKNKPKQGSANSKQNLNLFEH